jgi:exopolyphosphatase/guanosine-5'-triphosphate,3'-diphosphate pyrophosphatase
MAGGPFAPTALMDAVRTAVQGASATVSGRRPRLYAALDLGTNNCRLLIAQRARDGFRVVDSFSRIVRLGEGMAHTGVLSQAAMDRAVAALAACAAKLAKRSVDHVRCVATQACRTATNGAEFLDRVRVETGIDLEVITPEQEAQLAVLGCANLIDPAVEGALVVDIGGGSTELSWANLGRDPARPTIGAWTSIPIGVVTLADRHPETADTAAWYAAMKAEAAGHLEGFARLPAIADAFSRRRAHLVGTSGAVTSLAGVHLGLARYSRKRVDGMWIARRHTLDAIARLAGKSREERAREPCIGPDRADLVLAGGAILEAVLDVWPSERIRVADRGLREGIILSLLSERSRERDRRHPGRPDRRGRGR